MASNNNQINVPEAKEAMNRFKMECANEVGVNLKQGYQPSGRFCRRSDGQHNVPRTTNRIYADKLA